MSTFDLQSPEKQHIQATDGRLIYVNGVFSQSGETMYATYVYADDYMVWFAVQCDVKDSLWLQATYESLSVLKV